MLQSLLWHSLCHRAPWIWNDLTFHLKLTLSVSSENILKLFRNKFASVSLLYHGYLYHCVLPSLKSTYFSWYVITITDSSLWMFMPFNKIMLSPAVGYTQWYVQGQLNLNGNLSVLVDTILPSVTTMRKHSGFKWTPAQRACHCAATCHGMRRNM